MFTATAKCSVPSAKTESCAQCSLSSYCAHPGHAVSCSPPLHGDQKLGSGEHLYWHHDPMQAFYVIRSGCVKSYVIDTDGTERVRGFLHRGDLIGLDALNSSKAQSSVQALVDTEVCEIPRSFITRTAPTQPVLQQTLLSALSHALDQAYTLAGDYSADERIARFLIEISDRSEDPDQLMLHMGRRDIANYLRLVTETVSRTLTRFQNRGLICVNRRRVTLLERSALMRIAGLETPVVASRLTACVAA